MQSWAAAWLAAALSSWLKRLKLRFCRRLKLKKILVHRDEQILDDQYTTDFVEIVNDPEISVVCECIGGVEPAHSYVKRALEAGKHVVTANKKMLAVYAGELFDLARQKGLVLAYEPALAAASPGLTTSSTFSAWSRSRPSREFLTGPATTSFPRWQKRTWTLLLA